MLFKLVVVIAGNKDTPQTGHLLFQLMRKLRAVHHGHHHICQQQVNGAGAAVNLQCFLAIGGDQDVIAIVVENQFSEIENKRLIVCDQNRFSAAVLIHHFGTSIVQRTGVLAARKVKYSGEVTFLLTAFRCGGSYFCPDPTGPFLRGKTGADNARRRARRGTGAY